MSNPLLHAFFVGRALSEAINAQVEQSLTNALSELGKFDAEQRERLRQFTEQVLEKASQAEAKAAATQGYSSASASSSANGGGDLQAMLDELRAEIAQLRAELQRYRSASN